MRFPPLLLFLLMKMADPIPVSSYFGHGGAEQYIRSQTIRHFPRCAVTMLWGCSSGMLREQGDFDPVGTPYHYMVAGWCVLLRSSSTLTARHDAPRRRAAPPSSPTSGT